MRHRALWWATSVVLVLATVYLSLEPGGSLPTPGGFDKVEHFMTYAGLMLWFSGLVQRRHHWPLNLPLPTLVMAFTIQVYFLKPTVLYPTQWILTMPLLTYLTCLTPWRVV